jgi:hypothetical protein
MVRLKYGLITSPVALGLSATPAKAFGPMMMGGHQHDKDTGHGDGTAAHANVPHDPAHVRHERVNGRETFTPKSAIPPQYVDSRDASRTDTEHNR